MDRAPSAPIGPWPLAAFVAGTAGQLQQPQLWPADAYGLVAVAGLLVLLAAAWLARLPLRARGPRAAAWARAALLALALAGLGFALAGGRAVLRAADRLDPALDGRDLRVVGTVAAMPQRHPLGWRLQLAVEAAHRADGQPVRLPQRLALAWFGGADAADAGAAEGQGVAPRVQAGQRWQVTVRVRVPHGLRNPHGQDQELWLWEQGLGGTGTVRAGPADAPPRLLAATAAWPLEQARQRVRDAILAQVADPRAAGVLAALVVGDQAAIGRADWDLFRATGVAHLMSISGLHVTMFAWLAARLVGLGWRRSRRLCLAWPAPQAALAGGLVLATGYALFSGWGVPAQRTLLMLALVALLRAAGRHWPWPLVWLAACALVVAADPWALLQPGFWLSFVAVGVLFASDPGTPRPASGPGWRDRALGLLREQLLLTVALAPLTLLLFGQVAVAGLAANLLAIPWVTLVVTPLALAGVAWAPVWELAAVAVQALVAVLAPLASWPAAVWTSAAPPLWAGAAGVAGGLLLVLPVAPALRGLGLPLLLPVLLWQAPRPPPGAFELLAADVGQGSAVLVRTAGHTLVYDAGPRWSGDSDAGQRVLVPLLRALGERVDTLVLSHADTDHTGGAQAVLAQQPQAGLLHGLEAGHPLLAGRAALPCAAGQRWTWDGVAFEVLHPAPVDLWPGMRPNGRSCVLRVSDGRQAALLAGDIELPQEVALLARGASLQAQVVLVAHHGSRTSSAPAFVAATQAQWALVQAGRANRYGHPAPAVVARWEAAGARVVRSDGCGAAWWSSATPQALRCEREAVRRYWHFRAVPAVN